VIKLYIDGFIVGDAVLSVPWNPHCAVIGGSQGTATPTRRKFTPTLG